MSDKQHLARRLGRPRKRHTGFDNPWEALAYGILRRAVLDWKLDKPCSKHTCPGGVHTCREEAAAFLTGAWAAYLFDVVGNDRERALDALGIESPKPRRNCHAATGQK